MLIAFFDKSAHKFGGFYLPLPHLILKLVQHRNLVHHEVSVNTNP
jgi:hypothetical protein